MQELAELESALQEQREVNASLQQTQGELSAYETELETQLRLKEAEASQLKEELEKLTRLSQVSGAYAKYKWSSLCYLLCFRDSISLCSLAQAGKHPASAL